MQNDSNAEGHGDGRTDVRLASRVSPAVDRRLRLLVLIERQPLSHVLTRLLDEALPAADDLIDQLRHGEPAEAVA